MTPPIELPRSATAPSWFCLRSAPKHEHIAAAHLSRDPDMEVYLPRIRMKRATRRGPVWFTEALFPGYLFARFVLATSLRRVCHARGVRGVVHFGDRWPVVPEEAIEQLRIALGHGAVHVITNEMQPGETVRIAGGVFHGLRAVITRVMPSRERVAVLLEFLGRQTSVELPKAALIRDAEPRRLVL